MPRSRTIKDATPYVDSYFKRLHDLLHSEGLPQSEKSEGGTRSDRRRNLARDFREYPLNVRREYAQCAKSVRAARRAEVQGDLDATKLHLRQFRDAFHALLEAMHDNNGSGNSEN